MTELTTNFPGPPIEAPPTPSDAVGTTTSGSGSLPPTSLTVGRFMSLRPLVDRLARWTISFGGIAVILSILSIFVFLVMEVLPLFQAPTATRITQLTVPPSLSGSDAIVGVDEQQEITYCHPTEWDRLCLALDRSDDPG